LSVALLNDKVCERRFAINETNLASLESGMFVVVHRRSICSLQRWAETPQNDKFEKKRYFLFI